MTSESRICGQGFHPSACYSAFCISAPIHSLRYSPSRHEFLWPGCLFNDFCLTLDACSVLNPIARYPTNSPLRPQFPYQHLLFLPTLCLTRTEISYNKGLLFSYVVKFGPCLLDRLMDGTFHQCQLIEGWRKDQKEKDYIQIYRME